MITGFLIQFFAYIGPGLGAGAVATVIGILVSIFLAVFGIVWYPFKRFLKRKKSEEEE